MANEMIRQQLFGVEVEMTGISRRTAGRIVAEMLHVTASNPDSTVYETIKIKDLKGRTWKVMRDSSITPIRNDGTDEHLDQYRVEFVTPPLNYDDIRLLQSIIRKLRESGAKSHSSCGIHVHVDGSNHTPTSIVKLVNFMIARQDLIYSSLEIGDRASHWCKKLNSKLLQAMKKNPNLSKDDLEKIWYSEANDGYSSGINHSHYNNTRYHGVNLHAFFSKGTIEFRLFNSTLHAGKIKAYIQLCLALSAWSITSKDKLIFRSMTDYTPAKKVTIMRNILLRRLGLTGEEFETCRHHLMAPLKKAAGMNTRDSEAA